MSDNSYFTVVDLVLQPDDNVTLNVRNFSDLVLDNCGDIVKITKAIDIVGCTKTGVIEFAYQGKLIHAAAEGAGMFDTISYIEH